MTTTPLTSRQTEVMGLLSQGLGNKEIGDRLRISEQAVKAVVSRLLAKYGVRNRSGLVRKAIAERDSRISMDAGIAVVDLEGRILLMNDKGAELAHGFDETDTLRDQSERYHVRDAETHRQLQPEETPVGRALAGETVLNARILVRVPGESHDTIVRSFTSPLHDSHGRTSGAIALFWYENGHAT